MNRICTRAAGLVPRQHASAALSLTRRCVAGGMGRGDLYRANYENSNFRPRGLGIQRGLQHNSQATEPQTGQLYYRKRALHGSRRGSAAASSALRAPIAAWSHLLPSLRQGVEAGVPDATYRKLLRGEALTGAEAAALDEAQRLFRYELHQRVPLLEDTLADAELVFLVEWPLLFKRAWVALPGRGQSPSPAAPAPVDDAAEGAVATSGAATEAPLAPAGLDSLLLGDGAGRRHRTRAADVTPTAGQIFNLQERVALLTAQVERFAEAELRDAAGSGHRRHALERKWEEAKGWLAASP